MSENSIDHAKVVLEHAPIPIEQKADLWDAVYRTASVDSLARDLESFDLPAHLVAALVTARRLLEAEAPSHVEIAAQRMSRIDHNTLDLMERHPAVLRTMVSEISKKSETPSEQREQSLNRNVPSKQEHSEPEDITEE